jgi:hypothetical protein
VLTDWYGVMVPQAHELGISVYAVLDLYHAPLSDHRPESKMLLYDPTRRKVHPWTQFDLLAPAVQQQMAQLLADLLKTGVDGLVFRSRAENSFAYEVSDGVLRQFETQVHQPSSEVAQALRDRMALRPNEPAPNSDKTLWRWVGWKARQELDTLARFKKYLQKAVPRLRMVIEIHPEALSNPTSALVNYGEDAAEARRRGFDLLLGGRPARLRMSGRLAVRSRDGVAMSFNRRRASRKPFRRDGCCSAPRRSTGVACSRGSRSRRMNSARPTFVTWCLCRTRPW